MPREIDRDSWKLLAEISRRKWEGMISAQSRLIGWLFNIPGAGIAGALTFAVKSGSEMPVVVALILYVIALVLIVLYATAMYYKEREGVRGFFDDRKKYFDETPGMDWATLFARDAARPDEHPIGEILAWSSGIASFFGTSFLAAAVLTAN